MNESTGVACVALIWNVTDLFYNYRRVCRRVTDECRRVQTSVDESQTSVDESQTSVDE